METVPDTKADGARVAPARRRGARGPARGLGVAALLAATALAAAAERYPTSGSAAVTDLETAWAGLLVPPDLKLCTGRVSFTRGASSRDPDATTDAAPFWTPLSGYPEGDGTTCTTVGERTTVAHDGGGDLEAAGQDGYFMYRLTAVGPNVFLRLILEAEDAARETWRIRFQGVERARIENGPMVRGTSLVIRNDYLVSWNRQVTNTDGLAGEFDEDKVVRQDFAVRLRLVDGSEVHEGAKFELTAPSTVKTVRSNGPRAEAKVDGDGPSGGVGLGFTWGEEATYENFVELGREAREHTVAGTVSVVRALPCPSEVVAEVSTTFDGDFWVLDNEGFNGSFGARQELTLLVVHGIAEIQVTNCRDCLPPPPPPPPLPPPPTTPPSPLPPVTTPTEPAIPSAGRPLLPAVEAPWAPWLPAESTGPLVPLAPTAPTAPSCPTDGGPMLPTGEAPQAPGAPTEPSSPLVPTRPSGSVGPADDVRSGDPTWAGLRWVRDAEFGGRRAAFASVVAPARRSRAGDGVS